MTSSTNPPAGSAIRARPRVRRLALLVAAALTLGILGTAATVVVAPGSAASAACSIGTTALRVGSRGGAVVCLQRTLAAKRFSPGPIDGSFGSMTRSAVIRYQRANALRADGVVGRQTARSLGIWGGAGACAPPAGVPSTARQVVVVDATGTSATVDLLLKRPTGWTCARTGMFGRVGKNGIRPLSQRVAGDGTTPAGIFRLASMVAPDGQRFQFFGNGANPGVPGTWRQVEAGDCWDTSGGDTTYNTLTRRSAARCGSPNEYLPNYRNAYSQAALIGANMGPNRSGDEPGEIPRAGAIFLHHHSYNTDGTTRPTAGCVSLNSTNLAAVLRALVPGMAVFVIK